ncbi:MAG: DUF333 domain-containing protein [bacterium]
MKKEDLMNISALVVVGLLALKVIFYYTTGVPIADKNIKTESLSNPATVFCTEHAGRPEFVSDEKGNATGLCFFSDNSYCEEWAFYRGECKKGEINK